MANSAILFDLDGTIWESYSWYAKILTREVGGSVSHRIQQLRDGHSVVSMCAACGLSNSRFQTLCISSAGELPLYPEVSHCLEDLNRRGDQMGVVTSLPGRLAEPLLHKLGLADIFRVVIHAGNCRYRKPSPEPLLLALRLIRGEASGSWYVGDQGTDAKAAAAAGVRFAWASYGYGDDRPIGATVLKHFRDVLSL